MVYESSVSIVRQGMALASVAPPADEVEVAREPCELGHVVETCIDEHGPLGYLDAPFFHSMMFVGQGDKECISFVKLGS